MVTPRRGGAPATDPVDGGRGWRPSLGYLAAALGIAAGGLGFLMMSPSRDVVADTATTARLPASASVALPAWPVSAPAVSQVGVTPSVSPSAPQTREPDGVDPTADLSSYVPRGAKPTMKEVIDRLHQSGIETGLGAFSPPGTRPPLVGLAVPEDFVLPEGYVRHHQATDDGQRIEAILMYAPDHQFFDAANRPIEIPKDRVVPPEQAPPGLPIRRIVIPAPIEPASSGL